jgi:hypothetical protein
MSTNARPQGLFGLAQGEPRGRFRCSGCGARYDDVAWPTLALTERIDVDELRHLVVAWPEGMCIEIRLCAGCGHTIAAKHRTDAG